MKCLLCGSEDVKAIKTKDQVLPKEMGTEYQCSNCDRMFAVHEDETTEQGPL